MCTVYTEQYEWQVLYSKMALDFKTVGLIKRAVVWLSYTVKRFKNAKNLANLANIGEILQAFGENFTCIGTWLVDEIYEVRCAQLVELLQ